MFGEEYKSLSSSLCSSQLYVHEDKGANLIRNVGSDTQRRNVICQTNGIFNHTAAINSEPPISYRLGIPNF